MIIASACRSIIIKTLMTSQNSSLIVIVVYSMASIIMSVPTYFSCIDVQWVSNKKHILTSALLFWLYNSLSCRVLENFHVEVHCVAKLGKSLCVFAISLFVLGESKTLIEFAGIIICCLGMYIFTKPAKKSNAKNLVILRSSEMTIITCKSQICL